MNPPESIKNLKNEGCLRVTWSDGLVKDLSFRGLREACPCAHCIHEVTGEKLLDPATIPDDIHASELKLVGGYALRVSWSDGHDTGLLTWDRLREIAESLC